MKKYLQIKRYLLENISNGIYVPDRPLPTERELAEKFGVNRMTVRRAEEELMYDGLLFRKRGSGTYLTKSKLYRNDIAEEKGQESGERIRILDAKLCTEGLYGRRALHLSEKETYIRIRRVRILRNVPYVYDDIYLRTSFFPGLAEEGKLPGQLWKEERIASLRIADLLKGWAKAEEVSVRQTAEALLCLQKTADLLQVAVDSPILQVKTTVSSGDTPILFERSYHPGDTYIYEAEPVRICMNRK